jgi:hypothetical protein
VKIDPNAPPDPLAGAGGMPGMMGGMGGRGDRGDSDMPGGGMPAGIPGMMGGMMGGPGGTMGTAIVQKMRYLDINDQVRRMAIGVVLIVDQSRIQDVLTSFANSRLRFQITQVHWQHYQGSIKPPVVADDKKTDFSYNPGERGIPGRSASFGGDGGLPMGGTMPVPGIGQDQSLYNLNVNDESANVVELAVYGVASLYQRYPPKLPDAATPDAAGGKPAATPATTPKP